MEGEIKSTVQVRKEREQESRYKRKEKEGDLMERMRRT